MKMFIDNRGNTGIVVESAGFSVPIWVPIAIVVCTLVILAAFFLEPYFTGIDCPNCGERAELISTCSDYNCHYLANCGGGGKTYRCFECGYGGHYDKHGNRIWSH